ncbi:MAG: DUF2339 domain-containing protein [Defluviitaleaceae bacterium]|nr:DUF2339 domain-containing protein [Defluviitaleaceae bacterium]
MQELQNIVSRQKELLAELQARINEIQANDLYKENQELQASLKKLTIAHDALASDYEKIKEQNASLSNSLYEHTFSEKNRIIDNFEKKLHLMFQNTNDVALRRLKNLEYNVDARVYHLKQQLEAYHVQASEEIYTTLETIREEARKKIQEAQELAKQKLLEVDEAAMLEDIRNQEVTKDQVVALSKKNNIERLIGLNLINALGILLIIIGTIAAGHFVQARITNEMRLAGIFAGGIILLVAGEILNRRKANVFSLGLSAGGTAVMYIGLAFGFFGWEIFPMLVAIGICVAVTALAFWLSTHYKSQVLLTIAFVGGYLPLFTLTRSFNWPFYYGSMLYFLLLNMLVLAVSIKMKWTAPAFLGMFFSMASTWMIIFYIEELIMSDGIQLFHKIVLMAFATVSFAVYTAVPIIGVWLDKGRFRGSLAVMMAINTTASCVSLYLLLFILGWGRNIGLLAFVFAAVYIGACLIMRKKFDESARSTSEIFFLTGIIFVVLFVPMQFDLNWLTTGWLLQGVGLTTFGLLRNNRRFKIIGVIVSVLCLFALLFTRWSSFEYIAVTFGSVIILSAMVYKNEFVSRWHFAYKYVALVNFWLLLAYLIFRIDQRLTLLPEVFNSDYLLFASITTVTIITAIVYLRIRPILDWGVRVIAVCLYIASIVVALFANGMLSPIVYSMGDASVGLFIAGTVTLLVVATFVLAAVYNLLRFFVLHSSMPFAWLPFFIAVYSLVYLTQTLITQYNFQFYSMWISVIYMASALAFILYGFAKRQIIMRRLGLALALSAVAKLFLIDLAGLSQGLRIISYFVLGALLVVISLVYQLFSKRLEAMIKNEEKP